MMPKQPYSVPFLGVLDHSLDLCRKPTLWLFNDLVSSLTVLFYHDEAYRKAFGRSTGYCIITPVVYILLSLIFLPLGLLGFILGHIIQQFRQPYIYRKKSNSKVYRSNGIYSLATANLCLAPEFVSVGNNLPNTAERARTMGENLAKQQSSCWRLDTERQFHVKCTDAGHFSPKNYLQYLNGVSGEKSAYGVCTSFASLDVMCFQELLDKCYSDIFMEEIQKHFPYVVYDVRYNGWKTNRFVLNSGLGIASVYPILDVDFKVFEKKIRFCAFTCKGLLMCKVLLGERGNKREVGYVYNSHLQAYQGDSPVILHQLSQIEQWAAEFREQTQCQDETVMFDAICGDFNFDNLSPGDSNEAKHTLFNKYNDFARIGPGKDHDWTVGTERRQRVIHNPEVKTAEGLAECLQDPHYRQLHVLDANVKEHGFDLMTVMPDYDEEGSMILLPEGGKRRIDYVLYNRQEDLSVMEYRFVSQFASQTDHIPVSLTLKA